MLCSPTKWLNKTCLTYEMAMYWFGAMGCLNANGEWESKSLNVIKLIITRSPAIAEGPRDAGVPVEIW